MEAKCSGLILFAHEDCFLSTTAVDIFTQEERILCAGSGLAGFCVCFLRHTDQCSTRSTAWLACHSRRDSSLRNSGILRAIRPGGVFSPVLAGSPAPHGPVVPA